MENGNKMTRKTKEACTFHGCEVRLANQRGSQNTVYVTRNRKTQVRDSWVQNPKENPQVLHCSFPLSTYVLTVTDNLGSVVWRGPGFCDEWNLALPIYIQHPLVTSQNQTSGFFLTSLTLADLADKTQVRQDELLHVLLWAMRISSAKQEQD